MVNERVSIHRRSLRAGGASPFTEGSVRRDPAGHGVVVEVTGGPPWACLDVVVGGQPHRLDLDGAGGGRVELRAVDRAQPVEVLHRGAVVLAGRTPADPGSARPADRGGVA
jgi:hypothetical protein